MQMSLIAVQMDKYKCIPAKLRHKEARHAQKQSIMASDLSDLLSTTSRVNDINNWKSLPTDLPLESEKFEDLMAWLDIYTNEKSLSMEMVQCIVELLLQSNMSPDMDQEILTKAAKIKATNKSPEVERLLSQLISHCEQRPVFKKRPREPDVSYSPPSKYSRQGSLKLLDLNYDIVDYAKDDNLVHQNTPSIQEPEKENNKEPAHVFQGKKKNLITVNKSNFKTYVTQRNAMAVLCRYTQTLPLQKIAKYEVKEDKIHKQFTAKVSLYEGSAFYATITCWNPTIAKALAAQELLHELVSRGVEIDITERMLTEHLEAQEIIQSKKAEAKKKSKKGSHDEVIITEKEMFKINNYNCINILRRHSMGAYHEEPLFKMCVSRDDIFEMTCKIESIKLVQYASHHSEWHVKRLCVMRMCEKILQKERSMTVLRCDLEDAKE
ncbi:hypothetical protein AKO1_010635 [Acrasis kona]|uniref:DRBM domain-containing protein n=1 Tax=Acrasis kona TaxID=1008807 RepID=A0AAW2ZIV9_9EUKA